MTKLWWFSLMLGLCPLALAGGLVNGTLTYSIHHDRLGNIGAHQVSIRGDREAQVIEVTTRLSVPVLFFTYQEQVRHSEIWRQGRLISFRRATRKGDADAVEALEVAAWASGDRLIVEGRSGREALPGDVVSSHPWNPRLVEQSRLMLAETGQLAPVVVTSQGMDTVLVGGELVPARKYVLSGGLNRELWYDAHDMCLQVRLRKRGGLVTVTLQNSGASGDMAALRSALKAFMAFSAAHDS